MHLGTPYVLILVLLFIIEPNIKKQALLILATAPDRTLDGSV